jgi:hypothetical protein
MPKISVSTQVGPDVKDRFFLLVDDRPRAVFRTLEGAMEGFRTTLEILGDLPLAPSHEDIPWLPLPDPVQENQVTLRLRWTADSRTARAIKRQAKLMGAILGGGSIPFTH